ncbi:hypothetical protein ABPG74_001943 [Tetrahymena malaccensis]
MLNNYVLLEEQNMKVSRKNIQSVQKYEEYKQGTLFNINPLTKQQHYTCYKINVNQSKNQIYPLPISMRSEYASIVQQNSLAIQTSLDGAQNVIDSMSVTSIYLVTSNGQVLQIQNNGIIQVPSELQNSAFYAILLINEQRMQSSQDQLDFFQNACQIIYYPKMTIKEFVLVNQSQFMISVPLTSQIDDIYSLVVSYPTTFASQTQTASNLGCQLYTDYGILNQCSFSINAQSGQSSVIFNITNLNLKSQNISATVMLNYTTFNKNSLQGQSFQVQLLNYYQNMIAQTPLIAIKDYSQCQQVAFSSQLVNYTQQTQRVYIKFTPSTQNITRLVIQFSQQVQIKINSTSIFVQFSDLAQTLSFTVACRKVYSSLFFCDLLGPLPFDVSQGTILTLPYFQINPAMLQGNLALNIKYFTDYIYKNCFASNITLQYQPQPLSAPTAILFANNTLQISLYNTIDLNSQANLNIWIWNYQLIFNKITLKCINYIHYSIFIAINVLSWFFILTNKCKITKNFFYLSNFNTIIQKVKLNTILCDLGSPSSIMIQIINSFGLTFIAGSVSLQIQPYPILIQSINQIYQAQQQSNSSFPSPVALQIDFSLQANYFPSSSVFFIYLPPQVLRDNRLASVTVDITNDFSSYCKSQTITTQIFKQSIQFDAQVQLRDTISIQCQFSGNSTFIVSQNLFTASIQGYQLPRQIQKPTDRVIIELIDYSVLSQQSTNKCQTSESLLTPNQLRNSWIFMNNQTSNFQQVFYSYTSSNSSQALNQLQSLINITTGYPIQDGDFIQVLFQKQFFFKLESTNVTSFSQQTTLYSEFKNLTCVFIQPQSTVLSQNNSVFPCVLFEGPSYYSIKLTVYPSLLNQISTWDYKNLAFFITGVAFQQNTFENNTFVQFQHFSYDNFLVSESALKYNISSQITLITSYQINQISLFTLQSLSSPISNLKFDFIQLEFLINPISIPNSSRYNLNINFSQQIYFSEQSFCSVHSQCSQLKLVALCSLSADGLSITVQQIDTQTACDSTLANFVLKIHNPEINNSNSTGGAQSIAINWNLTSTTTSQTLLSGHTSLTTNTSQCPQPHCATCSSLPSICLHCTQGYYLLPDQTSCVQTCPPPTVPHQQTATCQPCFQQQECLQCQSQNPAACTSCSPNYSLNSTLLPYCYVPLPPSSSGPSSSSTSSSPSSSPSSPPSSSSSSSSVTKDVVNRTSSNSTFSGELNRLERGGQQQQQSQKQQEAQASDEGGFASFLAETKSYTKGLILTLLIPLSILGACLTRLVTFCLKKREKKVHAQPSESRSAQIAQNLDERQETQKDGNGGDEEQMRASSRVDTGNMCPLNSRRGEQLQLGSVEQQSDGAGGGEREGNGHLAFCWVAVILLLGNLGDLVEVPYIMFSQQSSFSKKSTSVFELQFWEADMGQICCLSYIALNGICYLICVVLMVKAIIFESGSGEPLFSIYEVRLSSRSSFCSVGGEEMKKDKSEVEWKGDSNRQNENKEKHKKGVSGRKLWKLTIDVLLRCLVVVGGKAFCMVYSNVANVKGWLTCQVNKNLRAFRLFYMILCIHAIFNMISAAFFTFVLTHFSFVSWAAVVGQDSLTSQGIDGRVEFSFFVDILAFKFLMSLICFLNCMHIQQLIAACKSSNLPGHQHSTSHPVQSPSTPSSSPSPAGAVARGVGKASYFENTPNAEKTTPTTVTLASYRQQDASGTGSQNLIEGRPRRKKPSKLSLLLKGDSGQKPGGSSSSRQQETPSPNLPSYSPNLYPSQAYI